MKLLKDLTDNFQQPEYKFGRPSLPLGDMLYSSVMKVFTTFSLRRFMSDMQIAMEKDYVSCKPCYASVGHFLQREDITPILARMVIITSLPLTSVENDFAVDSTGFRTGNSSIWYDIRIRRKNKRKDCIKLHISMDIDTGIIHWFTMTPWNRHDSKEFENLIKHLPELGATFGDKAYPSRRNYQLVVDKNGTPYLCFKENATNKAKGKPAWIVHVRKYKKDRETWLSAYYFRSIVESVFSSIKKRWGSFLRSRKRWMQKKELSLKVLSYNVKQVLMVQRAMECKIPLWKTLE